MKDFLKYVANDLLKKFNGDFSDVAVVFPNKRASLFLNSYLVEECTHPIWSPRYITISDLFRNHSQLVTADKIPLIFELFKCYHKHIKSAETIDSFYNWGEIMLADFDDIDKNMADADAVFSLTRDYGEMENLDYLTENQKKELGHYFSDKNIKSRLKDNFNHIYEHLADIYHDYNNVLKGQGYAYEGALYREVTENLDNIDFKYKKYVFIGFNMLQKVEERLFEHLEKQGKALFYWDFDKYYTSQQNNLLLEAGHYISKNINKFPNALDNNDKCIYDNLNDISQPKDIDIISATTENAQAHYITQWLDEDKIKCGRKTAIVMCDEMMLQSAIHCMPDNENLKVNITTGYPLQQTPVASFVQQLLDLYTEGFDHEKNNYLVRYVIPILNHPFTSGLCTDTHDITSTFRKQSMSRTSAAQFIDKGEMLKQIFQPLNFENGNVSLEITKRISSLLRYVSSNFKYDSPLYTESIFRMYTLMQILGDTLSQYSEMNISILTYRKLASQIISMTSIPFHGEPIDGIQVMGVLETRNIDFDNILLLSCNEGKIPKGINDTSFIPYTIRKGFGLTTVDHKVDIYAYYFYRMMQRAKHVSIVYNASTEGSHKNEMSRFVLQMIVEQCHNFKFFALDSAVKTIEKQPCEITKSDFAMNKLNGMNKISPSALNTFINCGLRFYYKYIAGIKEPEVIMSEKDIDPRTFGNIFHKAAEIIYEGERLITESKIKARMKKTYIERVVGEAFKDVIFKDNSSSKISDFNGLQRIIFNVICKYLYNMLESDLKRVPFEIISTEKEIGIKINVCDRLIGIGGIADRIDTKGDITYIVDYKTGKEEKTAIPSIEDLFIRSLEKPKYDYYLQTILYCIAKSYISKCKTSPVLLHIGSFNKYDTYPVLKINSVPVEISHGCEDESTFIKCTTEALTKLFSPDIPFRPTLKVKNCEYCPFSALCYGKEIEKKNY